MERNIITELGEKRIDELLSYTPGYSAQNAENIKELFMHKTEKKNFSGKRARVALIAAIVAALCFTAAAAYGNEIVGAIRQIMFGDSIATQVVSDNDLYIGSWGVMNRNDLDAKDYPLGLFDTLEEARQAAPFPIREPSFLPDNVTGLRSVGVWRVETTGAPWLHFVILTYDVAMESGGASTLQLIQTYAGPDAYFVIENVSPMEVVIVGGSEAVLISAPEKFAFDDGTVIVNHDVIRYTLCWLKDGIAFELEAWNRDGHTPETMIRIAESIR
jgi:hypothetical protein